MADILAGVLTGYRNNERDTIEHAERRIKKHLTPFFGQWNAASVTDDQVRKYIDEAEGRGRGEWQHPTASCPC